MAHNKEELKERINNLPLFEKRDVKVRDSKDIEQDEWTNQTEMAICEVGKNHAYAYVGPKYTLVQFKDVFLPILDSIEGDAEGYLCDYGGYASLKFFPEMEELKDGDSRFGLIAANSVDYSSSIIVRFCVEHNKLRFSIPTKIAGIKKQHTGNVELITKNYISLIGGVKAAWKVIIEKFPQYKIVNELSESEDLELEIGAVIEQLNLGKRFNKKLVDAVTQTKVNGQHYTLWDVFINLIEEISDKDYKSEVHREKKIDKVCQIIFDYSMVLNL